MSSLAGQAVLPGRARDAAPRAGSRGARAPGARARAERAPGARRRPRRLLRLVLATVAVMVVLELVFLLLLAPRMRLATVTVTTDLALSDAGVLALAGLAGDEPFFSLDAAAIEARLEQHPLVSAATVALRFPDTLQLTLTARAPAAVVLTAAAAGGVQAALVDAGGLVFLEGAAPWGSERAADAPVLTGLAPEVVQAGRLLPAAVRGVLADLQALRSADPVLAGLVSEVRLVPIGGAAAAAPLSREALQAGFETLLYPIGFDTVLRFGSRLTAERLAEAFVLLDLMRARAAPRPAAGELDLRSGAPVATTLRRRTAHGE